MITIIGYVLTKKVSCSVQFETLEQGKKQIESENPEFKVKHLEYEENEEYTDKCKKK